MSLFGDMFEDEDDCSLTTFNTGQGSHASRVSRPIFFDRRAQTGFAGLLNQGATCYLNSLIQALYMTPELREGLYSLGPDDLQVLVPIPLGEQAKEKSENKETSSSDSKNPSAPPETKDVKGEEVNSEREEGKQFLLGMGFEEALVELALNRYPEPAERSSAVDWLLRGAPGAHTSTSANDKKRGRDELEADDNGGGDEGVLPFGGDSKNFDASDFDLFSGAEAAFSSDVSEEIESRPPANPPPSPVQSTREQNKEGQTQEQEEEEDDSNKEWACGACTFLNPPDLSCCEICSTAKPKRVKAPSSTSKNKRIKTGEDSSAKPSEGNEKQQQEGKASDTNSNDSAGEDSSKAAESSSSPPAPAPTHRVVKREIPIELQRLFALLQAADQEALSTEALTDSFGWKGTNQMFDQHDVHELNRVLFDAIERSLDSTPAQHLLPDLYKGVLVNQIICCNCRKISANEEPFQDLTLPVVGHSSVQSSLAGCTSYETLSGDNQYFCEKCNAKVDALKGSSYRTLPPILTLALSRFTFDIETESRVKQTGHFSYPLILDLHPYTEEISVRTTLNSMEAHTTTTTAAPESNTPAGATTTPTTKGMQDKKGGKKDQELNEEEEREARERKQRKKQANRDRKAQALFELSGVNSESKYIYYLFAVVIHAGKDAGYGHYHAYIRDVFHPHRVKAMKEKAQKNSTKQESPQTEKEVQAEASPQSATPSDGSVEQNRKGEEDSSSPDNHNNGPLFVELEGLQGGWYDFNDSFTKSIPVETLASQYSGKGECAYMLIYRRKDLDEACLKKGEPIIPLHLQAEMSNHNLMMEKERAHYIERQNDIDILVFSPVHLDIVGGVLRKNEDLDEAKKKRARQLITLKKDTPFHVLVDKIIELFGQDVPLKDQLKLDQIQFQGNRVHFSKAISVDEENSNKTLEELKIGDHTILAWDGTTVNGKKWDGESDHITVTVTCYTGPLSEEGLPIAPSPDMLSKVTTTDYSIRISEKAFLQQLKDKLEELTGIPAELQLVYKPQYRELVLVEENRISLFNLGIYNLSKLNVEQRPPDSSQSAAELRSWSWLMFLKRQNMVEIFVTDKITGYTPYPSLTVELEKTATVLDLKLAIASKMPEGLINVQHVTVRKTLPGGGAGAICTDDALPLTHAGITDGVRVIAEADEEASGVSMMTIRFICGFAHFLVQKGAEQIFEIAVPKSYTIRQCKESMLELFNKKGAYRLATTNVWEKPDKFFDDEEITLEIAKVFDNDLLWLEEGKPPVKGQIAIDFQLYFLQDPEFYEPTKGRQQDADDGSKQFNNTNFWRIPILPLVDLDEEEKELLGTDTEPAPPQVDSVVYTTTDKEPIEKRPLYDLVMSPSVDLSPKAANHKARQDIFVVTPLWRLEVASSMSLLELKMLLIEKQTLNHVTSPLHVRLWHDDRLIKNNALSLKKQHIGNETILTIQLLDAPDPESTDGKMLFYVHKRNVKAKAFEAPLQYWFTGDTCKDLRNEISELLGIPEPHLYLAKYLHYNGKWRVLSDLFGMDGKEQESQIRARAKSKAKPQGIEALENEELIQGGNRNKKKSLQLKPFFMKDGDVIVAKDLREDFENDDDFVNQANQRGHGRTSKRRAQQQQGSKQKPKNRVREKGLYIHVADFSSLAKAQQPEQAAQETKED